MALDNVSSRAQSPSWLRICLMVLATCLSAFYLRPLDVLADAQQQAMVFGIKSRRVKILEANSLSFYPPMSSAAAQRAQLHSAQVAPPELNSFQGTSLENWTGRRGHHDSLDARKLANSKLTRSSLDTLSPAERDHLVAAAASEAATQDLMLARRWFELPDERLRPAVSLDEAGGQRTMDEEAPEGLLDRTPYLVTKIATGTRTNLAGANHHGVAPQSSYEPTHHRSLMEGSRQLRASHGKQQLIYPKYNLTADLMVGRPHELPPEIIYFFQGLEYHAVAVVSTICGSFLIVCSLVYLAGTNCWYSIPKRAPPAV